MVVRTNESAKGLMGHTDYKHRVGFAVPLKAPNDAGLPQGDEVGLLDEVEDALADILEAEQNSLMVLVVSTSGMREFVFYTRTPSQIEGYAQSVQQNFAEYELQFYVEADPDWELFKSFI